MDRSDLQRLAAVRVADAKTLLDAGQWSGAYYLAGYAVECALKACIAKLTAAEEFPNRVRTLGSYTQDIDTLMKTAQLKPQQIVAAKADPVFDGFWQNVKDWKETARYEIKSEAAARQLYAAVTEPRHGVLQWIMVRW